MTGEWLAKENNMKDLATDDWGRPLVSDQQDLSTVRKSVKKYYVVRPFVSPV